MKPYQGGNSYQQPYQGGNSYQQPYQGDNNYQQPYQGKTYYQQPTYVSNQLPPTTTSDEDPTNIIHLLAIAILSFGIFTLLSGNIGIVSSCILIGLGAEMMLDDSNLVKQGCCSLRGTAIAAIVMASVEFLGSLVPFAILSALFLRGVSSYSCYSCDYADIPSTTTYFSYNFGSSVFGTVTKISLCALYLHLTKGVKQMDDEEYPSLRQKTLSPKRVYYGFGTITLTIGIITLLSAHLGFISSCMIIALGAEWMKATRNNNEEKILRLKLELYSMKSIATVGIIFASIELFASIGFVSYMYLTIVRPSSQCSYNPYYPYNYFGCRTSDLFANFQGRIFAMYNLGAVLIGFVIKVLLFWMSLRLTSAHYDSSDENQVVVKEETSLLGSNTTQLRVGTSLAEVLQSKLREHDNRNK
jgi:hypothetical protein